MNQTNTTIWKVPQPGDCGFLGFDPDQGVEGLNDQLWSLMFEAGACFITTSVHPDSLWCLFHNC